MAGGCYDEQHRYRKHFYHWQNVLLGSAVIQHFLVKGAWRCEGSVLPPLDVGFQGTFALVNPYL